MSDDVLEEALKHLALSMYELACAIEEHDQPRSDHVAREMRQLLDWLEARKRSPLRDK